MESTFMKILITLAACCSMEAVAWFSHKYIMHGPLWMLHRDHHKKESSGFFEHNDFFFLIFAIPGFIGLLAGISQHFNYLFWTGLGISLYGLMYFLVHDIFIHRRFKLFRRSRYNYLRAISRAHKVHHKHIDRQHGECFGMLWVPMKYFRKTKSKKTNEVSLSGY